MPRSQSKRISPLTMARIARGVSQEKLADAVGVSYKTIERLEGGKLANPSYRLLNNCAIALGVEVEKLVEPNLREWFVFKTSNPKKRRLKPPDKRSFWSRKLRLPRWAEEHILQR